MSDFLVTASLLTSLATASIADPVELVAQVLNETLRPAAKISGTTVVGVTYLTQAQSPLVQQHQLSKIHLAAG